MFLLIWVGLEPPFEPALKWILTMNSSTFFSFIPFKSHFFVIFGLFWGPPEAPHLCPIYPYGPWPLVLLLTRLTKAKKKQVLMILYV